MTSRIFDSFRLAPCHSFLHQYLGNVIYRRPYYFLKVKHNIFFMFRPGKEIIPLSGGLFNREIYLDGLKRRSEALKPTSGGRLSVNSMCNLQ